MVPGALSGLVFRLQDLSGHGSQKNVYYVFNISRIGCRKAQGILGDTGIACFGPDEAIHCLPYELLLFHSPTEWNCLGPREAEFGVVVEPGLQR